jgi:hypothetical protein
MHEYFLGNGIRINTERLIDAALMDEKFPEVYLDVQTGALVEISTPESLVLWRDSVGEPARYLYLAAGERFIDEIISEIEPGLTKKAKKALHTGGVEEMEDFLEDQAAGLVFGWDAYMTSEASRYVHDWLTKNPDLDITTDFSGCDSCASCEYMEDHEESGSTYDSHFLHSNTGERHARTVSLSMDEVMKRVQEQLDSRSSKKKKGT